MLSHIEGCETNVDNLMNSLISDKYDKQTLKFFELFDDSNSHLMQLDSKLDKTAEIISKYKKEIARLEQIVELKESETEFINIEEFKYLFDFKNVNLIHQNVFIEKINDIFNQVNNDNLDKYLMKPLVDASEVYRLIYLDLNYM